MPRISEVASECFPRLNSVVLRVNGSLDLDTVLREIIEVACELTGVTRGVITALGKEGFVEDVVLSGFTPEQEEFLLTLPDRRKIYECLRHVRGVGTSATLPLPAKLESAVFPIPETFFGMPLQVRGRHVGNIFLLGTAGAGALSGKGERVLELLATLAATAIGNARAYREEQRAKSDLETLVRTSPIGVVVFDADNGKVALHNQEAMRLAQGLQLPHYSPEQLWKELTCRRADGRQIPLREFLLGDELRSAETVRSEEVELANPEGRSVSVLLNATRIRSTDGTVDSIVATMQDLAPLRELERLRAEFTGMVSHELRAPVTTIKGATSSVLGAPASTDRAEVLEYFRIIDAQADQLRGLLGDLLDAARTETGTLYVDARPCDMVDLIEQARKAFLSRDSSHAVLIDLPPEVPWIMADGQRIVQVLLNLFVNAARNSPDGAPIQVSAGLEDLHVAVSVSDEGVGIAPEQMPRLFKTHADNGGDGNHLWTRLGLVICRGLVEAHGGRIHAESDGVGRGATFTFTVPLAERSRRSHDTRANGSMRYLPAVNSSERTRILVVDDDPDSLRFIREALATSGYRPTVTADPDEVARLIRVERPDLVLLDFMLPGTTGLALLEDLPELADLPVIFISAYRHDDNMAKALDAGAADYMLKPFSRTVLAAKIRVALRGRRRLDTFGDLAIDYEGQRVTIGGRSVDLTAKEYGLLQALSRRPGSIVPYATLMHTVWGIESDGTAGLMRNVVMRLRRKLGDDPDNPTYVHNVRSVGYRMPKLPRD